MIRKITLGVCILFVTTGLYAGNKEQKRLENSGVVMEEIMNTPENIPQEVLEKAECVIVFPSVLKGAIGIGGSYGRGAMVCRTGAGFRGPWGAPAMYALEGGSFGFQTGWAGDRSCAPGHERSWRGVDPQQQGQAGCGCLRSGRS